MTFLFSLLLTFLTGLGTVPAQAAPAAVSPTLASPVNLELVDDLRSKAFEATNQGNFAAAEDYWSELIEQLPYEPAVWSNRGNARVSQNKLEAAIADYERSMELAPDAPDPYLNRGAALEGLGKWDEAIADYNHVLELDPNDPAAYNNRGNAKGGLGQWQERSPIIKKRQTWHLNMSLPAPTMPSPNIKLVKLAKLFAK